MELGIVKIHCPLYWKYVKAVWDVSYTKINPAIVCGTIEGRRYVLKLIMAENYFIVIIHFARELDDVMCRHY